jgi:hypothetical protein
MGKLELVIMSKMLAKPLAIVINI